MAEEEKKIETEEQEAEELNEEELDEVTGGVAKRNTMCGNAAKSKIG